MKARRIVLRIDDILNLLKDYCSPEDVPTESRPISFQIHPTTKKLAILIDGPTVQPGEMEVHFDLRRSFGVGG